MMDEENCIFNVVVTFIVSGGSGLNMSGTVIATTAPSSMQTASVVENGDLQSTTMNDDEQQQQHERYQHRHQQHRHVKIIDAVPLPNSTSSSGSSVHDLVLLSGASRSSSASISDACRSETPPTNNSGSGTTLAAVRRIRSTSGSKSEDHLMTTESGRVCIVVV
jgi:hypothetical protein